MDQRRRVERYRHLTSFFTDGGVERGIGSSGPVRQVMFRWLVAVGGVSLDMQGPGAVASGPPYLRQLRRRA